MPQPTELQYAEKKKKYDAAYAKGKPLVEDAAYDSFIIKFRKAYPRSKHLQEIAAATGRSKDREEIPIVIGSLDLQRPSNLSKWMQSISEIAFQKGWLVEPKFDGVSITLLYRDGALQKAWSRGKIKEGKSLGYDVTVAARSIQGVLSRLRKNKLFSAKGEILIRGEMIMHRSIFKEKYHNKPIGKEDGYQNSRNLCAGLINRKDISAIKPILKDCTFIALHLFQNTKYGWRRPFSTHKEWVYLTFAGMTTAVNPVRYSAGHWKIYNWVKEGHEALRDKLPIHEQGGTLGDYLYWDKIPTEAEVLERMDAIHSIVDIECDGIVVSPLDITKFIKRGDHLQSHPSFIRAVKKDIHDQLTKEGIVKEIEWNVTKRGLIKPVIILKTGLDFNGAIVNRVTGIHAKFIQTNQIQTGTRVKLIRSGDTIPRLLQVYKNSKWTKVVE